MRSRLLTSAAVCALLAVAACGTLSPMLTPPPEAVSGQRLVVFVPAEMDVWAEAPFDSVLTAGGRLDEVFRQSFEAELGRRLGFERVDVRPLPDSLGLAPRRFRLVEQRTETLRQVRLPAPGTVVRVGGGTPDAILFLESLALSRLRPGPGAVLGVRSSPAMAGGGWHGVTWEGLGALWDNVAGAPVFVASARGYGAFENQTGVLDSGDLTAQTWTDAVADLAERTAEAFHLARRDAAP